MVIGMIHGMLNVTVFSNTHHRPKKAFVLPFPNATQPRSVGSLHKPTENAFFNLRMKIQDRTIMVAGAQHCALEKTSTYVANLSNTQTTVPLSTSASFACHRTKASCRKNRHANRRCRYYPLPITRILFTFAALRHSRSHRARSLNRIRVMVIAASMRHTG